MFTFYRKWRHMFTLTMRFYLHVYITCTSREHRVYLIAPAKTRSTITWERNIRSFLCDCKCKMNAPPAKTGVFITSVFTLFPRTCPDIPGHAQCVLQANAPPCEGIKLTVSPEIAAISKLSSWRQLRLFDFCSLLVDCERRRRSENLFPVYSFFEILVKVLYDIVSVCLLLKNNLSSWRQLWPFDVCSLLVDCERRRRSENLFPVYSFFEILVKVLYDIVSVCLLLKNNLSSWRQLWPFDVCSLLVGCERRRRSESLFPVYSKWQTRRGMWRYRMHSVDLMNATHSMFLGTNVQLNS